MEGKPQRVFRPNPKPFAIMKFSSDILPVIADLNVTQESQVELIQAAHGGNLTVIAQATGLEQSDLLDFSVSINPLGPPDGVQAICTDSILFLTEYPDPNYGKLKTAFAEAVGISTECITVGNGSTELIYLLPKLIDRGKEVLIVSPCFSEYERAFQQDGKTIQHFMLSPNHNFSLPIDQFLFHLKQFPNLGGIVIGHPNNPTGTLLDVESFRTLSKYCERHGIFIFLDETFIDFVPTERSFFKYIDSCLHLILIRSLTKFYSLPGLRLGFGIMNPVNVQKIEAHQPPWSVNGLAQAVGIVLNQDITYPRMSRNLVETEKEYLSKSLSTIPDIEVFPSSANFILFRLLGEYRDEATRFFETLLYQGMVLRNCGNFIGLDSSYFRVAVRNRKDNLIFLSRVNEFFQSGKKT
jgi:threonine-phosphate decarboxylase